MSLSTAATEALRQLLVRHGEPSQLQLVMLINDLKDSSERPFRKGDVFLSAGQPARMAGLVVAGVQGEFYLSPDGSRKAKWLARPGDVMGSLEDLVSQDPSRTQIEALSDGAVLCIPYAQLRALALRERFWTAFFVSLIESLYRQKSQREHSLLMLDAAQRYEWFLDQFGDTAGLISQDVVASYLGISAVHLSRVRTARKRRSGLSAQAAAHPGQ